LDRPRSRISARLAIDFVLVSYDGSLYQARKTPAIFATCGEQARDSDDDYKQC